jgi:hypothetical protein
MPTSVFVIQHVHALADGTEDVKLIGVYSTLPAANEAVARARARPGFSASPDGFSVDEYLLDDDCWQEGYVSTD